MAYNFLPRNYHMESSITYHFCIIPSIYHCQPIDLEYYLQKQPNGAKYTPEQFAHLNSVLDEVNHKPHLPCIIKISSTAHIS